MKIGYLSDLHLNAYFYPDNIKAIKKSWVKDFFDRIFFTNTKNTTLPNVMVIAGDISHSNKLSILIFSMLEELYPEVELWLFVLGNHDYYLIGESVLTFDSGEQRVKNMKRLSSKLKKFKLLDGNVVEHNGIKFGGCAMWYDGKLTKDWVSTNNAVLNEEYVVDKLWRILIRDSSKIPDKKTYIDWFDQEYKKLEKICEKVDVLITHIHPVADNNFFNSKYQKINPLLKLKFEEIFQCRFASNFDPTNGFFSFDSQHIREKTTAKHWFFGHVHDSIEFEKDGIKFYANQIGYPKESSDGYTAKLKYVEIL